MKPMLAATLEDLGQLKYPVYASPKLDGVRGLIINGTLLSRSLKPIPNAFVTSRFSRDSSEGLDGELILGSPVAKDVYRATNASCSRQSGEPDVKFHVFDNFSRPALRYAERYDDVKEAVFGRRLPHVELVPSVLITNEQQLVSYEEECLNQGYEGLILRSPDGAYKFGRSTVNQLGMVKLKRFTDGEFLLLGVEEEMENTNEAKKNALGRTERSSHQAGLVGKGRAGTLLVRDVTSLVEFRIGTGLNDKDREWFWKNRRKLVGKFVGKYKSFLVGVKDKPRFPVYLGPRPGWDMS